MRARNNIYDDEKFNPRRNRMWIEKKKRFCMKSAYGGLTREGAYITKVTVQIILQLSNMIACTETLTQRIITSFLDCSVDINILQQQYVCNGKLKKLFEKNRSHEIHENYNRS